jgi:hypothetical protein
MTPEQQRALALARARRRRAEAAAQPQTSLAAQVGTGASEGIANMLGLPVDALTGALNFGMRQFGGPQIESPIGGSESIQGLLSPFMDPADPQTATQRIGRRVGNEVGAGAIAGPVAGINTLGGTALNAASSAGSGLAGGATAEAGGGPVAQIVASLIGGAAPVAATYAARPSPAPMSNQELRDASARMYDRVEASGAALTPRQAQELQGDVSAAVHPIMDPPSQGRAVSAVNRVYDANAFTPDGSAPLMDVERARRFAGSNVLASNQTDDAEKMVGGTIRRTIDNYLDNAAGADPVTAEAIDNLRTARDFSRRYIASETLDTAMRKAMRRANTGGSGGNEINTARQNIRAILDNPARAASFRPSELAQMEEIVMGTPGTNAARMIGGMSPTKGALPLMAGVAGSGVATVNVMNGNPLLAIAATAPSAIGLIAKEIGESMTDAQIQRLSATIRNGGVPIPGKALTASERAVIDALVARLAASDQTQATQ